MARMRHINEAYRLLLGHAAPPQRTKRKRMELVMRHWRPEVFLANEERRRIGILALCQIGLYWHPRDGYPFSFQRIAHLLRELEPTLVGKGISSVTLLDIENRDRSAGGS